ncbi:GDP-fucose protein O-fucosyltransferase 2-like [Ornithodoros turicata]|uniref:GDP-fucose protein O-fucosyltransferase 2-like n=1 Tax=Ornithodoros turicata TaxID=34597 RepID=UPI00313A311F
MKLLLVYFLVTAVLIISYASLRASATCDDLNTNDGPKSVCYTSTSSSRTARTTRTRKFLLYDVNPGEGFNLRRDVYMRMARLVSGLNNAQDTATWTLVLPPWGPLYHWRSRDVGFQGKIKWQEFFDVDSLASYVPVMEFVEYREESGPWIDRVYYLQHHNDTFISSDWNEKYEEQQCMEDTPYIEEGPKEFSGWFWGYSDVSARHFSCLSVQGYTSTLKPLILGLTNTRSVMIDRAEVVLHDVFGDAVYWRVRQSMRFSKTLRDLADKFRREVLDSDDVKDNTSLDFDWSTMKNAARSARGGPYLAVHLRRQDYIRSRPSDVPDIHHAAKQLLGLLQRTKLEKLFVATDGTEQEFEDLQSLIPCAVKYRAPEGQRLKDGSLAIIDQWIAAHARYFVGSYESTFSFRIQEEREILGFHPDTTFNRLCGNKDDMCSQPTRWMITYK